MSYSNRKIIRNSLQYESIMGDISKDMHRMAKEAIRKAGKHVEKKLREKCSYKFGSNSNITKGIGSRSLKTSTIVGVGPPAQAAHLIEFGTDERYHKTGAKRYTGRIQADPFVIPTYEEEAATVREILGREWF